MEAGSNGGVVTYALRALTKDGQQLWQQPLSKTVIGPDLYGGVLVGGASNPAGTTDFDGQTGSPIWSNNFVGSTVALRTESSNGWPGVLGDGGTAFVTSTPGTRDPVSSTIVAFDTNSGQQAWTVQPGFFVDQMFAQDGGGVIVHGVDVSNNPMLISIDSSGTVTPVAISGSLLTDSWTGQWFSVGPGVSPINLPFVVDQASFWPEVFGNPSQSSFGVPGCPCLVQSTNSTLPAQPTIATTTETEPSPETGQAPAENAPLAQLSGPSNCPICNLPQPEPPQCVTFPGAGATYLILVGDPGLQGHDLGDLPNLAAQQKANDLQAQGNKVIGCRISSIQDFNQELTQNGLITGDVIYFGHSGLREFVYSSGAIVRTSNIFVGQGTGAGTNITAQNVSQLCNTASCNIDNFLSKNTAIRLNGCAAGATILDGYAGYVTSIAQLISNQLKRRVYAYEVGTYFSQQDADHDQHYSGASVRALPDSLPMYAVPQGPKGGKPQPKPFCPGGPCK